MAVPSDEKPEFQKKKSKLFIISLFVFIILAGCFYGFFNQSLKNAAKSWSQEEIKSMTLPSLTVNLADVNRHGYLKTTITMEYVASKKLEKELEEESYKVMDTILKVLRNTTSVALSNPQETELLKMELLTEINSTLSNGKITGIFFEEFIVQ